MVETAAEALWQAESLRAMGKRRLTSWTDESDELHGKWRMMARAALLAAEAARPADDLAREVEVLREALRPFADLERVIATTHPGWGDDAYVSEWTPHGIRIRRAPFSLASALMSTNPRSIDTSAGCVDGEDTIGGGYGG